MNHNVVSNTHNKQPRKEHMPPSRRRPASSPAKKAGASARPKRTAASPPKFGTKAGSIKDLKATLKRKSGGGTWIKKIPKDGSLVVRFLQEPDEFIQYEECWDPTRKRSFPWAEGLVEGEDYERKSTCFLANALDRESGKVVPLQIKTTVLNRIILKFEKYSTILDRDYEIAKFGEKLDTEYDVTPESPSRFNASKYELLDLHAVLEAAYNEAMGEDGEDGLDPVKATTNKAAPRRAKRRAADPEAEEEEGEEEESED